MSSLCVYACPPLADTHVHAKPVDQAPLLRSGRAERRISTATRIHAFERDIAL
jgi:hypothetical protein